MPSTKLKFVEGVLNKSWFLVELGCISRVNFKYNNSIFNNKCYNYFVNVFKTESK